MWNACKAKQISTRGRLNSVQVVFGTKFDYLYSHSEFEDVHTKGQSGCCLCWNFDHLSKLPSVGNFIQLTNPTLLLSCHSIYTDVPFYFFLILNIQGIKMKS